jgi:hypothetical protein
MPKVKKNQPVTQLGNKKKKRKEKKRKAMEIQESANISQ